MPENKTPVSPNPGQTVGQFLNTPKAFNGYTLMAPKHNTVTYLIDNQGRVVHQWKSAYEPGQSAYLLPNGHLLRAGMLKVQGGTGGGELVCVDVAGSNVAWRVFMTADVAFNTPVAAGNLVIMGSRDGKVTAFAARDGAEQWQVSLSNVVKSLCVVDDAVFTVAGGALVGLRVKDGRRFLHVPIGDDVDGPVWNGRILVVAADGGNVIGFKGE